MEQGCKDTTHCGMTYDAASSAHGIVLAKAIAQKKSYQQLHQHRHQIRKRYNGQHIFLLRAALRHHHPAAAPCSGTMAKLQSQPTQHSESSTLQWHPNRTLTATPGNGAAASAPLKQETSKRKQHSCSGTLQQHESANSNLQRDFAGAPLQQHQQPSSKTETCNSCYT